MSGGFPILLDGIVGADLCCSCGTCAGACPQGIIRFAGDDCLPALTDPEACSECSRCAEVCPGRHVPYTELLQDRSASEEASHFGPHIAILRANATAPRLRERGASGGFVSALLSFLLDKGEIDAAIVAGADGFNRWGFPAGKGALVSKIYGTKVIPEILKKFLDGELSARDAARRMNEKVTALAQ